MLKFPQINFISLFIISYPLLYYQRLVTSHAFYSTAKIGTELVIKRQSTALNKIRYNISFANTINFFYTSFLKKSKRKQNKKRTAL